MSETIQPLFDRVLVKRSEVVKNTGGLYNPADDKKKLNRGEVVAVGAGAPQDDGTLRTMSVAPGDIVMFGNYNGEEVEVNGVQGHIIFGERDILAIIKSEG